MYLSYGELLTKQLAGRVRDQTELRTQSARAISTVDVIEADKYVQQVITETSGTTNLVVDSHALTSEDYGFRAVPFSAQQWQSLPFTRIVCLWAPSSVIRARVESDAGGRPLLTDEEFDMHAQLQSALALAYAHTAGLPIAFINSDSPLDSVVDAVLAFVESD